MLIYCWASPRGALSSMTSIKTKRQIYFFLFFLLEHKLNLFPRSINFCVPPRFLSIGGGDRLIWMWFFRFSKIFQKVFIFKNLQFLKLFISKVFVFEKFTKPRRVTSALVRGNVHFDVRVHRLQPASSNTSTVRGCGAQMAVLGLGNDNTVHVRLNDISTLQLNYSTFNNHQAKIKFLSYKLKNLLKLNLAKQALAWCP